ncbi:MAG: GntR family transcriptional regulator [Dehalococcoidia bacterium]|nr:MAG: GntR family transcriptional regulator [Dehalococcoidia bacterium]
MYQQITEQIRRLIATGQLKPGDRLAPVRLLAKHLGVNINTIVSAYKILEREDVIVSHRGGGTIVTAMADNPVIRTIRQKQLSDDISTSILKLLSQGYTSEEIETTFNIHISRWQEDEKVSFVGKDRGFGTEQSDNIIRIVGSSDLALNLLMEQFKKNSSGYRIAISYAGSLGGLIALQAERAHIAGIHLLDEETGEYNCPYIKRVLPSRKMAIINLTHRIQGLIYQKGNPKKIKGIDDLKRIDINFINRQRGSGTRVLLDLQLRKNGILPSEISGYDQEVSTHQAIASAIAKGKADVGLGIEAVAHNLKLDFSPLFKERYDLVMPVEKSKTEPISYLIKIIKSQSFKKAINQIGGYDTLETGNINHLE